LEEERGDKRSGGRGDEGGGALFVRGPAYELLQDGELTPQDVRGKFTQAAVSHDLLGQVDHADSQREQQKSE
jgi:hypothetical protein